MVSQPNSFFFQFQKPKVNLFCVPYSLSALELLSCVQHLLSWTSTHELLHEQFLINLFDLANWKEVSHRESKTSQFLFLLRQCELHFFFIFIL